MKHRSVIYGVTIVLMAAALACSGGRTRPTQAPPTAVTVVTELTATRESVATVTSTQPTAAPTALPAATSVAEKPVTGYRQWALSAIASSEYGDPSWSAQQATGKPDTPQCGDFASAWASGPSDTVEWIKLIYAVPVQPTQINIIQTYNPNQVVKVELIDAASNYYEVYNGKPEAVDVCPYTLSIHLQDVGFDMIALRITIDQSVLGLGWNEIDAVEVIGDVDRLIIPEPTTSAVVAWRSDGDLDGSGSWFSELKGMDATAEHIYVADAYGSVYVFETDGTFAGQIGAGEVGYVVDVKVGLSGRVYVADAGLRQVTMLSPEWDLLGGFGGYGTGDGEFGTDSPVALAVHPNGNVYILDRNEDANGAEITRVQVFDPDGLFLFSFPVEDDSARAMDFGPDANLYIACVSGVILRIDPDDGAVLDLLGQEALEYSYLQMLSIDNAGNFYVTTQIPAGAVKLDPEGSWLETIGVETVRTEDGWPEGEFLFPVGIAVSPDGRHIYIGDTYIDFSYLTAFVYPR